MKRLLLGLLFGAICLPLSARALTVETRDTVLNATTKVVEDTYVVAGGTLDLAGTYNNDVIIAGGNVTISGSVKGDVLAAGGNVKINGDVGGSVRAAGGTVEINKSVGRNVTLTGGTLLIDRGADVKGEAIMAGGTFTMNGTVHKGLSFTGGNAIINGTVNGKTAFRMADDCGETNCIVIGSNAKLNGDLEYWANIEPEIQTGATITGQTINHPIDVHINKDMLEHIWNAFQLWKFFATLLLSIVIVLVFPKTMQNVMSVMIQRMGRSIGIGAITTFAMPVVLVILAGTVIGIPLMLVLGVIWMLLYVIAGVLLNVFFGDVVLRAWRKIPASTPLSRGQLVWATVIGAIIISLVFDFLLGTSLSRGLVFITALGSLAKFGLAIWALGAIVMKAWETIKTQK